VKVVDSDALGEVTKALGLTGKGAGITEFLDGQLDQTLDVAPIVRRGRTQAGSQGIYTAALRNVHAGAGNLSTAVNPFDITVGALPPYPAPMPAQFDVWLIGAGVQRVSGTGTLAAGIFVRQGDAAGQGFGEDDSGVAVVSSRSTALAFWDSTVTELTTFALQNGSNPYQAINMRLRRPVTTVTFSSTASALATFEATLLIGVFPLSLGQDLVAG